VLTIDSQAKLGRLLVNRPLDDAWGINTRMEARLKMLGINDLGQLRAYDPDRIRRSLGRYGYYLWANVNGLEISEVSDGARPPKSVGHSYCLPKKTRDKAYLASILYKLCEKTGRRLRALGKEARVLHAGWAYAAGAGVPPAVSTRPETSPKLAGQRPGSNSAGGFSRSRVQPQAMFTTEEIFSPANAFLTNERLLMPVRLLFVSVSRLEPVSAQMSLFEDNLSKKGLSLAMDRLNDKYGEYTVIRGRMWGTGDNARDRIGFRKTVV
jgi:DNA polymerase IV